MASETYDGNGAVPAAPAGSGSGQAEGDGSVRPATVPPLPWRQASPRRRRRASGPALDRRGVVDAALRLVDDEGIDALSLRRLAVLLGVTPMALYWHVRDKAELLDLVGERLFDAIEVPPPVGDWRAQLREVHRAMLVPLLEHPNAVDLMIGRARFGPAGIALFERILAILRGAGLGPAEAFDAYQSLYLFQLGFSATARRSPAFRAVQAEGAAYLRSLDPAAFPAIAAVAPVIGRRSLEEQYALGLEVVLEGIAGTLVGGDWGRVTRDSGRPCGRVAGRSPGRGASGRSSRRRGRRAETRTHRDRQADDRQPQQHEADEELLGRRAEGAGADAEGEDEDERHERGPGGPDEQPRPRPPGRLEPQLTRGEDRAGGHRQEGDQGRQQVNSARARGRRAGSVGGEEGQHPGADRPGDDQGQPGPQRAARPAGNGDGADRGQAEPAADEEVEVHQPGPWPDAPVLALGAVEDREVRAQEDERDVDGHVDDYAGQR